MQIVDGRELMGRNEYATHRQCANNAVKKAEDSGRIAEAVLRGPGGEFIGIDWRLADRLWASNTDPVEAARSGSFPSDVPPHSDMVVPASPVDGVRQGDLVLPAVGSDVSPAMPAPAASEDRDDYLKHRTQTEKFRAQQAELDYLAALGRLVPVDEFREATFRRYRAIRDKLLNIPDRISTVLAAEKDASVVHQRMTAELKRVLSELSDDARSEAAAGPAERVAA